MKTFNNFLLSKLANNCFKGVDVYSQLHRYRSLWTIYCDFLLVFSLTIWKLTDYLCFPSIDNDTISLVFPVLGLSLICLKTGNTNMATALTLIGYHIGNFKASSRVPIIASMFAVLLQAMGFLLAPSPRVQATNFTACIIQNVRHMYNMNQVFFITLTEEQQYNIFHIYSISFFILIQNAVLFYILNTSKNSLWELAQSNFLKTEEIAKEMVQAAKAKDTFVSSLSHEIRNPLNCMNGSIDYLLQVVKNPNHLQILNNAKVSGDILLNLLSNVLDAAKLKAEKMELFYAETNIVDTIKKVMILFCGKIREKGIKTTVFIDRTLPRMIWADSSRILQLLINVLSNAVKFSQEEGKIELFLSWCPSTQSQNDLLSTLQQPQDEVILIDHSGFIDNERNYGVVSQCTMPDAPEEFTIHNKASHLKNFRLLRKQGQYSSSVSLKDGQVNKEFMSYNINECLINNNIQNMFSDLSANSPSKSAAKKGFLKIQVSDYGCGISPDMIPKLFEMFSQAEFHSEAASTGSGLGLWICKKLCSKMGGDIKLYSQIGAGTTFVFYIPIDNDRLTMISHVIPKRNRETLRALVVDDYPYNRDMHKLILERENIQVSVACDGKEALDIFTAHEEDYFQFIMMDVNMPVMDGFTAAKKIREWEEEKNRKKVDIYFVSGEYYDEKEVMRELGRDGAKAENEGIKCLKKPIDAGTIKKLVENFKH